MLDTSGWKFADYYTITDPPTITLAMSASAGDLCIGLISLPQFNTATNWFK